jgi:uncharacterized membrane protein YagU involved in acid resistance
MAIWTTGGSPVSPFARPRPFLAIFAGGLTVGILDMAYAILVYSPQKPILVPQTIASGILGMNSYLDGTRSAALGVLLHFVIAFGAATVYYAASRKLPFLVSRAVLCGLIYGALVYLFMHIVVLPLSAMPKGDTPLIYRLTEFVEHWFFVGLPISLSVRHYARRP